MGTATQVNIFGLNKHVREEAHVVTIMTTATKRKCEA